MRIIRIGAALLIASGLAACGITSPSDLTTETWTGTVHPGDVIGSSVALSTFNFNASKTGEFIVKVNSESPDSGATFGIIYGAMSAGVCSVEGSQPIAGQGQDAFDQTLPEGAYCLQAYDSIGLVRPETFNITVSHL